MVVDSSVDNDATCDTVLKKGAWYRTGTSVKWTGPEGWSPSTSVKE